jgi:flagellar L-ring protein FlgH
VKNVLIFLTILGIVSPVLAQDTRQPPVREVAQPPRNNLNAPPPNVGELLRRNKGSLFKAAVAMPDDPRMVRASDVSFFAVPPAKPRTLQKHDLITIVVREQSSFSSEGTAETKKDGSIDASIQQFPKLDLANFAIANAIGTVQPRIALSGERDYNGEGAVDRKDSFTARIQAEVVDVKPNGTLIVQARKRIVTDEEEQVFMLSGVCRVQDILPDNTVLSTQLYDLELRKTHTGVVHDATKRGWVPRALDWLNPF